jgi:hypothetical protein
MSEPKEQGSEMTFAEGAIEERPDRPVQKWLWVLWVIVFLAGIAYLIVTFHGRTLNPKTNTLIREYNKTVDAETE